MSKHAGKVAVITGGATGIGLATALLLAEEGAYVYVVGRREAELAAAAEALGSRGTALRVDISNLADLDRLFDTVKRDRDRLDILFANAAAIEIAPFGSITEEHFDRVFGTNVKGTLFTVQKALPLLGAGSSVILNASIAGSRGLPGFSVYGGTKAALRSFARTWMAELRGRGIRINVVSPGPIDNGVIDALAKTPEQAAYIREHLGDNVPLGRGAQSVEIARVVSFLASDEASFIAGVELFVDGGMAQI
jgi:NAD(P)-dependent dehydrogenase (short-subunit alcohol dehydrogenase family)